MRKFIVLSSLLFGLLVCLVATMTVVTSPSAKDFIATIIENTPWARNVAPVPSLTAQSYVIGDIDSGEILAELSGTKELPIASLTKLMTAIVAQDVFPPDMQIPITEAAVQEPGNSSKLQIGTKLTSKDLIYSLLMESSNDSAKALALHYGEQDFIQRMNLKTQKLNMLNTHFSDSSGLSNDNTSTARDLFQFAQYLTKEKPGILQITKTYHKTIRAYPYTHELRNSNVFTKDQQFIGGKVGETTAAKETMISVFTVQGRRIAVVVLRSENRESDTAKLLAWAKCRSHCSKTENAR